MLIYKVANCYQNPNTNQQFLNFKIGAIGIAYKIKNIVC